MKFKIESTGMGGKNAMKMESGLKVQKKFQMK